MAVGLCNGVVHILFVKEVSFLFSRESFWVSIDHWIFVPSICRIETSDASSFPVLNSWVSNMRGGHFPALNVV